MQTPGFRCSVFLGLLSLAGCAACAGRTPPRQLTTALPATSERGVMLREAWQTVLRERAAREERIAAVQDEEASQDLLARMPRVSLASGGTATLAEAMHLLLSGTSYSCEYEPGVDPLQPVATYIAHQRLDDAVASVVRPLGYTVEVAPLQRRLRIAPVQTRTWRVAAAPHDEAFWAEVRERVTTILRGDDERLVLRPGAVQIDREAQTVRVSAADARIADVAAYLTRLSTSASSTEEAP
jgi:hypothetical protein